MNSFQSSRSTATAAFVRLRSAAIIAAAMVSLVLVNAAPAHAQQKGTGVRAGVSSGPDQFYFGAHLDTGPIFDKVSFRPNVEVGIGDHLTTVTGNFEFVYWWRVSGHPWHIYGGGGPGIVFNKVRDGGGSSTDPGFNLLIGAAHNSGFFSEIKLGLMEHSPDFKFGVGYTWR